MCRWILDGSTSKSHNVKFGHTYVESVSYKKTDNRNIRLLSYMGLTLDVYRSLRCGRPLGKNNATFAKNMKEEL
jgi:hypothetical protein